MPRYDYRCTECGHEFEVKQSFSDEPVAGCPLCDVDCRRVIHSVPVVFKGSGFYVNDYGKGSNGRSRSSSDDYSEKKDTSGNGKSEAKSDSGGKAESKKEKVSSS